MRGELIEQMLRMATASSGVQVITSTHLPYESTDERNPGLIHAVMMNGVLVVSREMYQRMQASFEGPKP
jgi:hypothetical protein